MLIISFLVTTLLVLRLTTLLLREPTPPSITSCLAELPIMSFLACFRRRLKSK